MKSEKQIRTREKILQSKFMRMYKEYEYEKKFIHSKRARELKPQLKLLAYRCKELEWVLK